MRILLLCSIFFVVASTTYLEDKRFPAQIDDDDSEIVVKNFNKCSKDQYFDLYTASCQKCIKCPKGKFAINECKKFDNTECGSCNDKKYSNTRAYRTNCRGLPVKSGGYTIRNGMRKLEPSDIEVPWNNIGEVRSNRSKRIVQIKLQSFVRDRRQDEFEFDNEIPDLPFDDNDIDDASYDSLEDDEYEEFYNGLDLSSEEFDDLETVDAQIILPAARPILNQTGILEVMAMSDDLSDSDEDSNTESDSNSESIESAELRRLNWNPSEGKLKKVHRIDETAAAKSRLEGKLKEVHRIAENSDEINLNDEDDDDDVTTTKSPKTINFSDSVKVWNLVTKFFVFVAYCFAVMALFVAFRYAQNMRRQRTFNVQPLVMSEDQHHDLIRTVNYLQSKRRGPFKYEPLEEFV